MKRFAWFFLSMLMVSGAIRTVGQTLPDKQEILAKMVLANRYFQEKWQDPGLNIVTDKVRPSHIWTRAVYYEGLMALYQIKPDPSYYQYAVAWGESHKWGLNGGVSVRNADNQCCGQTYIDLYKIDKNPEWIKDIRESMDRMVQSDKIDDWTWIDALQMAMPVFSRLEQMYPGHGYGEKMYQMFRFSQTKQGGVGLYNPKEHLWWRDKDFLPPYKEPNGRNCYWSRGNGWVLAALVRVLETLPVEDPHRKAYAKVFKQMAEALRKVQRPDGFWNASLHDPANFGGKELTGTALFAYGMAWGINHGLLGSRKFRPVVINAWNAMAHEAIHDNGFLGYVQGTGKQPSDSQPVTFDKTPNFEDFGLGCFLLAGSEVYRLK
ncbi:MAG: glycoside hydrolase family 88 protein [Marinilabiliales bacterium]|nr:glycoside hydrolase family 88 protein [Marinilabiliales bacterium]